jgi:hypothetical protein
VSPERGEALNVGRDRCTHAPVLLGELFGWELGPDDHGLPRGETIDHDVPLLREVRADALRLEVASVHACRRDAAVDVEVQPARIGTTGIGEDDPEGLLARVIRDADVHLVVIWRQHRLDVAGLLSGLDDSDLLLPGPNGLVGRLRVALADARTAACDRDTECREDDERPVTHRCHPLAACREFTIV